MGCSKMKWIPLTALQVHWDISILRRQQSIYWESNRHSLTHSRSGSISRVISFIRHIFLFLIAFCPRKRFTAIHTQLFVLKLSKPNCISAPLRDKARHWRPQHWSWNATMGVIGEKRQLWRVTALMTILRTLRRVGEARNVIESNQINIVTFCWWKVISFLLVKHFSVCFFSLFPRFTYPFDLRKRRLLLFSTRLFSQTSIFNLRYYICFS